MHRTINIFFILFLGTCHPVSLSLPPNGNEQSRRDTNANGTCESPFTKMGTNCYNIVDGSSTGDEAFAKCEEMGGYLANFESIGELLLMQNYLRKHKSGYTHYFIGGRNTDRRIANHGGWKWIRGDKMIDMDYFPFVSSEPANSALEQCMILFKKYDYKVYAAKCYHYDWKIGYICEK